MEEERSFYILNDISEYVNLVQLLDSLGNVNNAISIVGRWIFDSNYNKPVFLTQELLDIIWYPSLAKNKLQRFNL